MQRDPSIHVRQSTLVRVFERLGLPVDQVPAVLALAAPYALKGRLVVTANAKQRPKLERTVAAGEVDVAKFNGQLYSVRLQRQHKGIKRIAPTDLEFSTLREIAVDATEFASAYDLELTRAYAMYCEIGIGLMGRKYALNKLKGYKERIFFRYEALTTIEEDQDRQATRKFYETWSAVMLQKTDVTLTVENDPEKFVNFVYGRQDADQAGADYRTWITAQFDGLAFLNHVPELSQLHGDGALNRYEKGIANKQQKKASTDEEGRVQAYSSPEEEAYYRAMRGES